MSIKYATRSTWQALHAVPDPVLAPTSCTPWCYDGKGHPTELFADDQTCISNVPSDTVTIADGTKVFAYAVRPGRTSRGVHIDFAIEGDDCATYVSITDAEALRIIAALQLTYDLVVATRSNDRVCVDCGVMFQWDESADDDRCAHCADVHEWNHGGAA